MPRVYTKTARASKRARRCTGCRGLIEPGQHYYTYSRRFGRSGMDYFRHVACGYPRPTELSSRKTAQVVEAIQDAEGAISSWTFELPDDAAPGESVEIDIGELESAISEVASVAESVADEYEDSFNNLPENFQSGSTGEAIQAVADELREWASDRESWSPDADTSFELPERDVELDELENGDDLDDEETARLEQLRDQWREAAADALQSHVDEIRSEAEQALEDLPEYQG